MKSRQELVRSTPALIGSHWTSRSRWSPAARTTGARASGTRSTRPSARPRTHASGPTRPHARIHSRAVHALEVAHRLKFHLLLRRQFVLDPDSHPHVQRLDLAFSVEDFVELGERLLFVYLRRLHRFVQRFHRVLQLPLQFIKARGRALNLAPHELLLFVSQSQLALMLHDHVRWKHSIS